MSRFLFKNEAFRLIKLKVAGEKIACAVFRTVKGWDSEELAGLRVGISPRNIKFRVM